MVRRKNKRRLDRKIIVLFKPGVRMSLGVRLQPSKQGGTVPTVHVLRIFVSVGSVSSRRYGEDVLIPNRRTVKESSDPRFDVRDSGVYGPGPVYQIWGRVNKSFHCQRTQICKRNPCKDISRRSLRVYYPVYNHCYVVT